MLVPVLLDAAPPEPYVVLTRRRADLRRHAGEISFPGGRQDAEDATLIDTALREGTTRTHVQRRGFTFETDAYIVGEHVIWGATARIVAHLLERLDSFIPPSRPAPPRGSPTPSRSRRSS